MLPKLRGCFVGSGSSGMQSPVIAAAIMELVPLKSRENPNALYIGTATYDLPEPRIKQTKALEAAGCIIDDLCCSDVNDSSLQEIETKIAWADIIVVSGGNTLFMVDTWKARGIDVLILEAASRGCVLCGGSAGAIAWFDGGHSDSADPETYRDFMLQEESRESHKADDTDEASEAPSNKTKKKDWDYIRAPCLSFLPGLVCPHYDKTQSNGKPRSEDFDAMLLRHPNELGICIDHNAALIIDSFEDIYRVVTIPDQKGSVDINGNFLQEAVGKPGVWLREVTGTETKEFMRTLLPASGGKLSKLLRKCKGHILEDDRVFKCREENKIST